MDNARRTETKHAVGREVLRIPFCIPARFAGQIRNALVKFTAMRSYATYQAHCDWRIRVTHRIDVALMRVLRNHECPRRGRRKWLCQIEILEDRCLLAMPRRYRGDHRLLDLRLRWTRHACGEGWHGRTGNHEPQPPHHSAARHRGYTPNDVRGIRLQPVGGNFQSRLTIRMIRQQTQAASRGTRGQPDGSAGRRPAPWPAPRPG